MKPLHYAFQMSKLMIFEVNYGTSYGVGSNYYFSTSYAEFDRGPKNDYCGCGQGQDQALIGYDKAMSFYKKWDVLHLKDLTEAQHNELMADIEVLKVEYNYIERFTDNRFGFRDIVDLSKKKVKKSLTVTLS